jgi:hypothetical protein
VVEGGFRYKGTVYKSLTAAAEAITGMKLSGRNFFGLPKQTRGPRREAGGRSR